MAYYGDAICLLKRNH